MIEFRLDNTPLVVGRNTSVKLRWVNPAVKFDEIPSDAGLGIDIGVNVHTKHIFGNPERFEKYNAGNNREFPNFEIRFSGMLLHAGTFIITNADNVNYTGWVRGNVANIGKAEREKYINENERFDTEIPFVNKIAYTPSTDAFCFPKIYNPDFFSKIGASLKAKRMIDDPKNPGTEIEEEYDTTALTYWFLKTTNGIINSLDQFHFINNPDALFKIYNLIEKVEPKVNAVVPMFYLNYILEEILKSHHYKIVDNFLKDDPQFHHLCLYNNHDITINEPINISQEIMWDAIDFGDYILAGGYEFYGSEFEAIHRKTLAGVKIKAKNHLPKSKLSDFLLGIQNYLNIIFFFKRDNTVNIIDRESILTNSSYSLDQYFIEQWALNEKKNVAIKFSMEHDNDDLIFNELYTDLSDRFEDILGPVVNWEALAAITDPQPGNIRYVMDQNVYAEYGWAVKTLTDPETWEDVSINKLGWEIISIGYQPGFYNYGMDEQEEIKTVFSTLTLTAGLKTRQPGSMDYKKFRVSGFSPRLIYDTLSHYQYKNLDWNHYMEGIFFNGDFGLIATRYKNWAPFLANRLPVFGKFQLPLNILYYVIDNIFRKYQTRKGEFIIETMETEFKGNRIGPTEIQGYKA